jgi:uncharacterized protein (TIGR00290 family)
MVNGFMKKIWLSWSSGKDSAFALHVLRQQKEYEVVGLLTTVTSEFDRVAMHAVRTDLLQRQAQALNLPLIKIEIPSPCTNEEYEQRMRAAITRAQQEGITGIAFGDLFLTDIRAYREKMLEGTGLTPIFPLWLRPTGALAREMFAQGIKAVLTCIDPRKLKPEFCGRFFDESLLHDFPEGIDPCGENGEFHSFVFESPDFTNPIPIEVGQTIERDGFVFTDVLPASSGQKKLVD